jgi:hypothetical protein
LLVVTYSDFAIIASAENKIPAKIRDWIAGWEYMARIASAIGEVKASTCAEAVSDGVKSHLNDYADRLS